MDTNQYFSKRRSIRKFENRQVDSHLLKNLLEEAMHAPTTGNMQLYSVVVTRDRLRKESLAKWHYNQPASVSCDVMLTFCLDFNRFEHWCRINNAVPGYDNFQSFMMGVLDVTIYAQQFVTLAELNGLGTCYLGTTTYNARQIAETLRLPGRVVPVVTIAAGYPAENPEDCGRLSVDAVMHEEVYHDYSDDDIRNLYREKEQRDDSARFVAENNKENLAQVFTDVRYTRDSLNEFSTVYRDFVLDSGFKL